ncbi:MAG: hypothetical protein ACRC5R_00705 [Mycoplasmatales bacterium]
MMNFSVFFLRTRPLLDVQKCCFKYQRKNCKKHGHYKKKTDRLTGFVTYEISIEQFDNSAGKIYTYAHELTHMLNNHLDTKILTYAQQECVAHEVGMYFVRYFELESKLKKSSLCKKYNINDYANMWIKGKKVPNKRKKIMEQQIKDTIIKIRYVGQF